MDTKIRSALRKLTNVELLERVKNMAKCEREATVSLIAHLAELEERRLYLAEGYSSLFSYCTGVLHLSEHAAYGRIEAARLLERYPIILEMLEQGSVNLTTVCLLGKHLTWVNHKEVLELAKHKSKRQVEELVARLHPQPPVPSTIRKLPTRSQISVSLAGDCDAPSRLQPTGDGQDTVTVDLPSLNFMPSRSQATIVPLAPESYKVQFTASAGTYKKLRLAQDLLRHQIPNGDPAAIIDRALTALLENLTKQKLAATDRPRKSREHVPGSRHIQAEVKRAVWLRDGGRCAFEGQSGTRCTERGFLEYHHVTPHASGGLATVENIQLRCRAHNGYESELIFAPARLARRERKECDLAKASIRLI